MSTVRVTYHGMDGEGRSLKGAKRDAARKLEASVSGSYAPWYFRDKGIALLLWREPAGWTYRIIWPDMDVGLLYPGSYSAATDFETVRRSTVHRFARAIYSDVQSVPKALVEVLEDDGMRNLQLFFENLQRSHSPGFSPEPGQAPMAPDSSSDTLSPR
jgi:hypothetical protein